MEQLKPTINNFQTIISNIGNDDDLCKLHKCRLIQQLSTEECDLITYKMEAKDMTKHKDNIIFCGRQIDINKYTNQTQ